MGKSPYEPRAFWKETEKIKPITEDDIRKIVREEFKKLLESQKKENE